VCLRHSGCLGHKRVLLHRKECAQWRQPFGVARTHVSNDGGTTACRLVGVVSARLHVPKLDFAVRGPADVVL